MNKKQQKQKLHSLQEKQTENYKESQHKALQKEYKRLSDTFLSLEKKLIDSELRHRQICKENEKVKKELSELKLQEAITTYLKNEMYVFLISEGYRFDYTKNKWKRIK